MLQRESANGQQSWPPMLQVPDRIAAASSVTIHRLAKAPISNSLGID